VKRLKVVKFSEYVGSDDGNCEGESEGLEDGTSLGSLEGLVNGLTDGKIVGGINGWLVGNLVGRCTVGLDVANDGLRVEKDDDTGRRVEVGAVEFCINLRYTNDDDG
jgi:hypothetical protein